MAITAALKEWAAVIDALLTGETILLLRKGGIREQGGQFRIAHDRVLLFPTYEHQRSHLLKSGTAPKLAQSGQVILSAWAQITHVFEVHESAQLEYLRPWHVWTDAFVHERFNWKPQQPLSVLLLRTYALAQSVTIVDAERYGGCRSWIELDTPVAIDASQPVLNQAEYERRTQAIRTAI